MGGLVPERTVRVGVLVGPPGVSVGTTGVSVGVSVGGAGVGLPVEGKHGGPCPDLPSRKPHVLPLVSNTAGLVMANFHVLSFAVINS